MGAVMEVLTQQIALAIPVLFAAAIPLVLAGMRRLTARVAPAIAAAVDEVEREKAADPTRYATPASMRAAAVRKVRMQTGGTMMSIIPNTRLEGAIDATVAARKVTSTPPPPVTGDGES
jgi:hypothetical protein